MCCLRARQRHISSYEQPRVKEVWYRCHAFEANQADDCKIAPRPSSSRINHQINVLLPCKIRGAHAHELFNVCTSKTLLKGIKSQPLQFTQCIKEGLERVAAFQLCLPPALIGLGQADQPSPPSDVHVVRCSAIEAQDAACACIVQQGLAPCNYHTPG